jgi:2',3'-cyclic-nucleotide 2'-phosphodiesterase (5'-nucleotidase family)
MLMKTRNSFSFISVAFIFASFIGPAHAALLHILHTNDLHSHLDHSPEDPTVGGYAAVKATLDRLKAEAEDQGIETLVLDAGDFSEGSRFHMADRSLHTWRAMAAMGYDAVTIGNHDWLQGPEDLDWVIGQSQPLPFQFLGANFHAEPALRPHLAEALKPYARFHKAGARIAVLGLTTPEALYSWRAKESIITSDITEARQRVPELRAQNDFVIALSHLGVSEDQVLARSVPGIDLIVGGHSHTVLQTPITIRNMGSARDVPIVQTGTAGRFVGDLLVDFEPGKPVTVLSYRLVPVSAQGPRDSTVAQIVTQAESALEAEYGAAWLKETIGSSSVDLKGATLGETTVWSRFATSAMAEAVGASVALDVPNFTGLGLPAGPITREDLIELYPRRFEFAHRQGWTIWTALVRGWMLKLMLAKGAQLVYPHQAHGIENMMIAESALALDSWYKIALPEGVARGAYEVPNGISGHLANLTDTGIPIWTALETKLRAVKVLKP